MTGYLMLAGIFVAMIVACFAFAISELVRPRDPGPLPIDVSRDINHRYFATLIRRQSPPFAVHDSGAQAFEPVRVPAGAQLGDTYSNTYITGDGTVLPGAYVESVISDDVAVVGEGAFVARHAEGLRELIVSAKATVEGRVTSAGRIVLAPTSRVFNAAAPMIRTSGLELRDMPPPIAPWDSALDADFEWLLSIGTPVDLAFRDIELAASSMLDCKEALLQFERQALRPTSLIDLKTSMTPSWIGDMRGWYLGAATIRIRGDVELPEDSFVPYGIIVEGDLLAQPGVRFGSGVHADGNVILGDECRVSGSVVAGRHVVLGDDVTVDECVSARLDAFVGSRVWVGGDRNGGLAAGRSAELGFGTVIRQRLYAEDGACVKALATEFEIEKLHSIML